MLTLCIAFCVQKYMTINFYNMIMPKSTILLKQNKTKQHSYFDCALSVVTPQWQLSWKTTFNSCNCKLYILNIFSGIKNDEVFTWTQHKTLPRYTLSLLLYFWADAYHIFRAQQ